MDCNSIKEYFVDYIDGKLNCTEEKLVSGHLEACKECREELLAMKTLVMSIDKSIMTIDIPPDFMDNVRNRINKTKNSARKRKPLKVILIAAIILVMSAASVLASSGDLFEIIKAMNPKARISSIVDKGFGNRLNISKVDKDIKITVTDVAADDIQTLISFKIEDLKKGKYYNADFENGINIKERWGDRKEDPISNMYISMFSTMGESALTLRPIDTSEKTIHLSFNKLELKEGEKKSYIEGNWEFEIPLKKYEGKSYKIDSSLKIDGFNINFYKINVSPTLTTLYFNYKNGNSKVKMTNLEDVSLIANGKEYGTYNFGNESAGSYSPSGSGSSELTFESMFFDNPKNIEIKISSINTDIALEEEKEFIIGLYKTSPQEFEFLGTKIYVDNIKAGDNITFDLSESVENRQYETLDTMFKSVTSEDEENHFSKVVGSHTEAFIVDEDNNKYDFFDALSMWDKIRNKKPAYYPSKINYSMNPSENWDIRKEKAIKMVITGYSKTKFVDETVKVKLK